MHRLLNMGLRTEWNRTKRMWIQKKWEMLSNYRRLRELHPRTRDNIPNKIGPKLPTFPQISYTNLTSSTPIIGHENNLINYGLNTIIIQGQLQKRNNLLTMKLL